MNENEWLMERFEEHRSRLRAVAYQLLGSLSEAEDAVQEALQAESVGLALLVVLNRLTLAERLAFVLHDLFEVRFEEMAPIVGRSPAAARQLASRARRRVQGGRPALPTTDVRRRREVIDAFLAASKGGDFATRWRCSIPMSCSVPNAWPCGRGSERDSRCDGRGQGPS